MSTVLTYGLILPQTGDAGSVFFPALAADITQIDAHTHDGITSAKLPSSSVAATTISVPSGSWSATSGGMYRQSVTMPGIMLYADYRMIAQDSSTGEQVYVHVEKITTTTFYVYTNNSAVSYTLAFLS